MYFLWKTEENYPFIIIKYLATIVKTGIHSNNYTVTVQMPVCNKYM